VYSTKGPLIVEETIQVIVDDINVEISKPKEDCENEVSQNLKKLSLDQNQSNSLDDDPFNKEHEL